PEGKEVKRVYIEEGSDIGEELYLSVVLDRAYSAVTFIGSKEGGVNIEDVAHSNPEKIITVPVDPAAGIQPYHARKLAFGMQIPVELHGDFQKRIFGIYDAFIKTDASQVEINPLVITKQNKLIALDAKFNFDDNALFRQPEVAEMRDEDEEDPLELQAAKF